MDRLTSIGIAIALSFGMACGDDTSGTSTGAGGTSAGTGANGGNGGVTTNTGGSPGTGAATTSGGAGGNGAGGAGVGGGDGTTGCAEPGGAPCPGELQCCSGEPYPPEGVCHPDCPLVSDRAQKQSFQSIDRDQVLERLSDLPITEWSYLRDGADVRHIGPMAQDFRAAFGLGSDETHIHPIDAQGVTIAGVQALYERLKHLEAENAGLRRQQRALEERLERLERMR